MSRKKKERTPEERWESFQASIEAIYSMGIRGYQSYRFKNTRKAIEGLNKIVMEAHSRRTGKFGTYANELLKRLLEETKDMPELPS